MMTTDSYTFAYIELLFAAFKPRYCRTLAQAPLIHMSRRDPPKEIPQIIEAVTKAKKHLHFSE